MGNSSKIQIINRGFILEENLNNYMNTTKAELLELLNSKEAYKRTIAIRLLSPLAD